MHFDVPFPFSVFFICVFVFARSEKFEVIELDHELGKQMPYFPNERNEPFKLTVLEAGYRFGFWFAQNQFTSLELMGTYVLAPYSLNPTGSKINEIPVEDFFATVALIDVRSKASNNSNYEVSVDDVTDWLKRNGRFPKKCVVLFNTAWNEGRYPDQIAYYGSDDNLFEMKYPGVSLSALEIILKYEKSQGINIVGFGIDTPILDIGGSRTFLVSRRVAALSKYGIYNLKNLKKLPETGARIMIMPIKLTNGSAAPARVVARLPYN